MITKIHYDIASAILAIDPDAKVKVNNEDIDNIEWTSSEISKSDIQTKIAELKAADDALAYARNREPEYPSIGDQLDALYHAGVFPTDMANKIKAVKDKYPKG